MSVRERPFPVKHGHARWKNHSPTYRTWTMMHVRCRNNPYYVRRHITINSRWNLFENFLSDMGERPTGMTLDRIDNNKGYSPENCRWADHVTQTNNTIKNVHVSAFGEVKTVAQWTRDYRCRVGYSCLYKRIVVRHWNPERSITKPCGAEAE